jgi:[acyl-carrier-protein] S-malonyltransferase
MTNQSPIAFLFPGQGSQCAGMGKELASNYPIARRTFEEADDALGYKISDLCHEGPEDKLRLTEITQPAILTASLAALRVLAEKGVKPDYVAGHSLGEYSAHVAAGTLSLSDAVKTVRNRGRYMQEAVPVGVGAMAAIVGLTLDKVSDLAKESTQGEVCDIGNINSPEQIVLSGHSGAIDRAARLAPERGAKKAVILPVSAPFHCSLMQPAQDRLAEDLKALQLSDPECPVVSNVDAAIVHHAEASRDALIRQVTGTVRWEPSIRVLIEKGVQAFIEVGPGKVLWGLMRQIDRSKTSLTVSDEQSLEKTLSQLATAVA